MDTENVERFRKDALGDIGQFHRNVALIRLRLNISEELHNDLVDAILRYSATLVDPNPSYQGAQFLEKFIIEKTQEIIRMEWKRAAGGK